MQKLKELWKSRNGNTLLENVIILPLIFIIIYALLMTAFVMHDRSTLEAAAKRGAIYAAHIICNPNYDSILSGSGNQQGKLDTSVEAASQLSFSGIGHNIQPYRYITGSTKQNLESKVKQEVMAIVQETKIPWRELDTETITCETRNYIIYQDVTVSIDGKYPIPKFFEIIGLDNQFTYTVSARMTVNDPDEFLRNADLVVDTITRIDKASGGGLHDIADKISALAQKLLEWIQLGS